MDSDLDIALILPHTSRMSINDFYHAVYSELTEINQDSFLVNKRNVAISFEINNNRYDIIPAKRSETNPDYVSLWSERENKRKVTSFTGQIHEVEECNCNQALVLLKKWKQNTNLKVSNFILERAIVSTLNENFQDSSLHDKIEGALCTIPSVSRKEIFDPTNYSNNVSSKKRLPEKDFKKFKKEAAKSCSSIRNGERLFDS